MISFTTLKYLAVIAAVTVILSVVNNYTGLSGQIARKDAEIQRLEGRLQGAYMRIERRDNAIGALPSRCRILAQNWVKTGDIPAPFKPFDNPGER